MWDFDPFSSMDSIDYSSFEPAFTYDTFDVGFSDSFFSDYAGFDMGGVGDAGAWGYVEPDASMVAPIQDGSYSTLDGWWGYGDAMDVQAPTDFGTVWEADFPLSSDGFNLPNVSAGQLFDVAKAGASIYTMTQSGPEPSPTRPSVTAAGQSVNGDAFKSIIKNVTDVVRAGAATYANIEDTRERVMNASTVNTARGASSGLFGPRTTTAQGSVTRSPNTGGGMSVSPMMLALGGVLAFVALKG